MRIKYLGTAAAEGWPAVFCKCEACIRASQSRGKNIRTRSQVIINDDLLIDFPAESYYRAVHNNIDLGAIKYLLVTHSHSDHFYPQEFVLRGGCYAHNLYPVKLQIYCNQYVKKIFDDYTKREMEEVVSQNLEFHVIKAFDIFTMGEYKITALPAKHTKVEDDLLFLIEISGKKLFYCNDTGRLTEEVYEYFKANHIVLNMVSFDCTGGPIENGVESGHMGIADNIAVRDKLREIGAINEQTKLVITHFSHNGGLLHEELEAIAHPLGLEVAYDFMTVEI